MEEKAEPRTESKEVEQIQEPLKYTTWVLKVSIHCEGCRRKIKKILKEIDGVYTTNIDVKKQKVVVIGNVGPDVLIKRIMKAGRHAELWPEGNEQRQRKQSKPKSKDGETEDEESSDGEGEDKEEGRDELKRAVTFSAGGQPQPHGGEGAAAGGGNKKKKKKKRKKKTSTTATTTTTTTNSNANGNPGGQATLNIGAPPSMEPPPPVNTHVQGQWAASPPRHHVSCPSHYYSPPPARTVYATSYNTACPPPSTSTVYAPSYYSSPPPLAYSYPYMDRASDDESPASDHETSESFEFLSDENPNACLVM